ncbi:SDR family oxidoreductase [Streptomyces pristinaespiralis]|uniref:SDR family oxidoreductase n=1 Tax=Streptomyces pristinaespiralis TaxID=38300 RepID=UPI00384BDA02
MRVAVAGGTGLAGRHVVGELRAAGHEPVVLARSNGVDVTTGQGLAEALAGVEAVIDVTNAATLSRRKAVAFFEAASRHLLAAGERAGVRHHVVLSIVGIERVGHGYYQGRSARSRSWRAARSRGRCCGRRSSTSSPTSSSTACPARWR